MALEAPTSQDRLNFAFKVLTGYKVEAHVTSGLVYEGILVGACYDPKTEPSQHGVCLKFAKVIKDPNDNLSKDAPAVKPVKKKVIPASELVQLLAKDVRMNAADVSGAHDEFETDAAISRGRGGAFGRDLQRWMPEEGDTGPMISLGDSTGGWDQFAVNRDKFGVTTTYNEELYTTVLDKSNCAISEEAASRLAREIEQGVHGASGLAAYHMAEERGMEVDDGTMMTEEDRYGAVVREAQGQPEQRRSTAPHAMPGPHAMGGAPPPPPPRAWGGHGTGVAAVAGRTTGANGESTSGGGAAAPPSGTTSTSGAGAPVVMGGLSQGLAAAKSAAGASAPGPWRSAPVTANGEDSGRNASHNKAHNRMQGSSNALPIRGQKSGGPGDRHPVVDALNLALPGPGSTPPDVRGEFGRWKAQKNDMQKEAECQRMLDDLRAIASANNPTFVRHSFNPQQATAAGGQQTATAFHQVTPATSASQPAVTPATAAAATTAPAPAAAAAAPATASAAAPTTAAATPAAAAAAPAAAPKKSALNPNAKEFTLNVSAKPFVPGGAAPSAASAPIATAAPQAVPQVIGFGVKPPGAAGSYVGPHAIPVHAPIALHGNVQHALGHGDGHHGHSSHAGHHVVPGSENVVNMMHAPGVMRVAGIPGTPATAATGDHMSHVGSGNGPHGLPVSMAPPSMAPGAIQAINPANGMPFVTLASPGGYNQTMQVGPNGQPMQINPGMMNPHGMMGGPQVMFTGAQQHGHVRPGSMPAGGAQQVAIMPVMQPGGMQQHGGYNYMPGGPQGYTVVPMPGNAPIATAMQLGHGPGMGGMQGGPPMGPGHVGNQGGDMHMRPQGSGGMKGMMGQGGGRGGGRGGRGGAHGMDGHGHMGMQHGGHMSNMGSGHMVSPSMVVHVAHDGAKPQPPPPPPPMEQGGHGQSYHA